MKQVSDAAMPPISAAIVGAGLMGYWHAQAIGRAGGHVVAVLDQEAQAAQQLARGLPGAQSFTELARMLAEVRPQVLHVCTPTPTHVACVEAAIAQGCHVLVEKPMAATGPETARLFAQAAKQGVLICPVHQFSFQEGVRQVSSTLSRLGKLVRLTSTIRSAGGAGRTGPVLDQIMIDILPHSLSLMQLFLADGLPALTWQTVHALPGELVAIGVVDGTTVTIDISLQGRPPLNTFEIVGANGTVHLDLFHGYAFAEPGAVSRLRKITQPFTVATRQLAAATINLGRRAVRRELAYPGLCKLIRLFYQAVQTGVAPPILPAAAVAVAQARDKILLEMLQ
jgi:predicted dehydrogenase